MDERRFGGASRMSGIASCKHQRKRFIAGIVKSFSHENRLAGSRFVVQAVLSFAVAALG